MLHDNRHKFQRRKAGDIPYVNHPIEVAAILTEAGVSDPEVIAAALLHDTIEDTDTKPEEIEAAFGPRVLRMVQQCSDDKNLPYLERKRLQIEHAPHLPDDTKLVKMGDKIANLRGLLLPYTSIWNVEVTQGYFAWSRAVCEGCRGANAKLDAMADELFTKTFKTADGKEYPATPSDMTQEQVLERYYAVKKQSG